MGCYIEQYNGHPGNSESRLPAEEKSNDRQQTIRHLPDRQKTMNATLPRFEFRIFGTSLGMAEQRMRAIASCEAITESREVYLLGSDPACDRNVKIRHGILELKQLIERYQGLQRWRPAGQWEFPVAPGTVDDILKTDDILSQAAGPGVMLSRNDLLRLVAQPAVHLHHASVHKRRFRFTLAGCSAEFDQLLVNGATIESIAIESVDPQAVLEVQATLRLDDFENQSYPLALSRILGIMPLPRENDSA